MNTSAFDLFNFYVLCGEPSTPRLFKVPLERALQQELTVHFESLRAAFSNRAAEYVAYDPGYRPEQHELFRIAEFRLSAPLRPLGVSAPSLRPVDDATLESDRVKALIAAGVAPRGGGPLLLFQAIDSRQVLRREGLAFLLSDRVFRRNDRAGLLVRDALDAVFENGALCFASEYVTRRFLDLSALFEEATEPEVIRFFAHELFGSADRKQVEALCDQWTRRKIKMLLGDGALDRVSLPQLVEHARRFQLKLGLREDRLLIPKQKKELKLLLRLLDEDFLESTLTQARFLANSKRRLSPRDAASRPA